MWKGVGLWQAGGNYVHEATSWRGRPAPTGYTWFLSSAWQERSERLYGLADEVEKKLAGK